ncbi:hypothetical protein ACLOJK_041465 [Asimina triloba]
MLNGARLLEEFIASCGGKVNPIRIFSAKELKEATSSYDQRKILVRGGMYTAYEGTYRDRAIVVRVLNFTSFATIENVFTEIVMLSQINHKNVVRLLGCCIETEDPRPVYEFIGNGSLAFHIHEMHPSVLSWETRLRIATEIASALTYLHTAPREPIVHMDIRSMNILLDERFTVKISNFGNSKTLSESGNAVIKDIDPMQMWEDVFGFGKLLFELLAGEMHQAIFDVGSVWADDDVDGAEVEHFASSLKKRCLASNIGILEEGKETQWLECTKLALNCISRHKRLTIKEVAEELRRIRNLGQQGKKERPIVSH